MIKTYNEYINLYWYWQNYWWKINYINKIIDDIQNNVYKLNDEKKYKLIDELDEIEQNISKTINDWLDKALLIKSSIS
jgi:hypothetical protein